MRPLSTPLATLLRRPAVLKPSTTTATTIRNPSTTITTIRYSSSSSSSSTPPPSTQTYYHLFPRTLPLGPPPSGPFAIPLRPLRAEYLSLQQLVHPDLQHSPPPSTSTSTPSLPTNLTSHLLQKAYSTLATPLLRAEYILTLPHTSPPSTPQQQQHQQQPAIDLPTLLTLHEAISDAIDAHDHAALAQLRKENAERIAREEGEVGRCLEEGRFDEARKGVERWRYWLSLGGRLEED